MERSRYRSPTLVRDLLAAFVLIVLLVGLVAWAVYNANYAAARTAYGGRRMTRSEAEAIRGKHFMLDRLPDSEFLPEPQAAE